MKLIYIANARIPTEKAHGYQIAKMCEEFALAGLEAELWLPSRGNSIKDDLFSFYGLARAFKIRELESHDFISQEKYLGKLSYWLQTFGFMLKLLAVKVEKDSLIYTRQPEIAWLFSLKGFRTVYEAHRWPLKHSSLHSYLVRRVAKIVVLTNGLKELFLKHGFEADRILVAPDGVDLKIFDLDLSKEKARDQLALDQDKIILGYTGSFKTMGKDKGLLDILHSLKLILSDFKNILFVAVGGSKQDIEYYHKIAIDLKLADKVWLLERVELSELAIYQKAFDVLLMPFPRIEHYAFYMSPLKMFEYMTSGRPIVATDLPAIKEVLNPTNSFLARPGNAKDLACVIKEVLSNPEQAEKKAKQAFLEVKGYGWGRRVWKIIDFIS